MIAENVHELESKAHEVYSGFGYSKNTIGVRLTIARALIRLHDEQGEEQLNDEVVVNYVKNQETRYLNGEICRGSFLVRRGVAEHLTQINDTGTIIHKRHKRHIGLPDYFERVLLDILANEKRNPKFNKEQHGRINTFFRWLTSRRHIDLRCVDENTVHEYLFDCSSRMVGHSLDKTRRALKELFLFLSDDGTLPKPLNKLFLFSIPIEKKIKPFMPQDDIAAVLNVIDRSTMYGKRDYAIILLAAVTGLRRIDIAELTLDSIRWRNGEIRIILEKTGKALALPLTTDVGKALSDYILNARPYSKSNKVFLCGRAPFRAINKETLSANLKKHCIKAGLATNRGFHAIRRGVATNMVISGVSVITVAQALGHATINPTKQYISLDSRRLKECALDFHGIRVGGDE